MVFNLSHHLTIQINLASFSMLLLCKLNHEQFFLHRGVYSSLGWVIAKRESWAEQDSCSVSKATKFSAERECLRGVRMPARSANAWATPGWTASTNITQEKWWCVVLTTNVMHRCNVLPVELVHLPGRCKLFLPLSSKPLQVVARSSQFLWVTK